MARIDWREVTPMPLWTETVRDLNSPQQRLRAYAFWCGLIWQYAALYDKLDCLRLPEPSFGTPMPVWLHGRLISQDLALAALNINVIARSVPLDNVRNVLEIGAGYGKLAYVFTSLFPNVEFTIADISPALAVSKSYLAAVVKGKKLRFVLPHELDAMLDDTFDLVINVSSLDEMPPSVQDRYLERIDRLCRGHLYLAGYSRHLGDRIGLSELHYDPRWIALYDKAMRCFRYGSRRFLRSLKKIRLDVETACLPSVVCRNTASLGTPRFANGA
jgi:SAM-dependent methyltransferase